MLVVRDFELREGTQLNQGSVHLAVSKIDPETCESFLVAQVGKWFLAGQAVLFTIVRRNVLTTSITVRSPRDRFGTFAKRGKPVSTGHYFLTLITSDGTRPIEMNNLWERVLEEAALRWPDLDMDKFRKTALVVR